MFLLGYLCGCVSVVVLLALAIRRGSAGSLYRGGVGMAATIEDHEAPMGPVTFVEPVKAFEDEPK